VSREKWTFFARCEAYFWWEAEPNPVYHGAMDIQEKFGKVRATIFVVGLAILAVIAVAKFAIR
jgi:hypothetical protein